ncbi:MAG TPA: PadR family transcriptional regulator [Candidatus Saccharimonadales bacterium]|nr:PadR family transcriptional regulator [Candidatus Saccharimonadales bacterium]
MTTSYALLGIVERQSSYGYDLKRSYDLLFGHNKPLAFGQVYATLSRLKRDGKTTEESIQQESGPERKLYKITDKGRKDLEEWLTLPEKFKTHSQTTFFVKVVTAISLDKDPDIFLDAQRAAHIEKMRELTKERRSGDIAKVLQADYALYHLEADIRWIDMTAARLSQLRQEVRGE